MHAASNYYRQSRKMHTYLTPAEPAPRSKLGRTRSKDEFCQKRNSDSANTEISLHHLKYSPVALVLPGRKLGRDSGILESSNEIITMAADGGAKQMHLPQFKNVSHPHTELPLRLRVFDGARIISCAFLSVSSFLSFPLSLTLHRAGTIHDGEGHQGPFRQSSWTKRCQMG